MRLAGIELTDDCLLALVTRLRGADLDNQADRIVDALMSMQTEATLTRPDRDAILTRGARGTPGHAPAGTSRASARRDGVAAGAFGAMSVGEHCDSAASGFGYGLHVGGDRGDWRPRSDRGASGNGARSCHR